MRIPKVLNLFMAGFVYLSFTVPFLFLSGCSVTSPLLSGRANKASVIIIKPPMKIILSGEYSKIQPEDLVKLMKELRHHKYYNYNFDDSITIDSEHVTSHKDSYSSTHQRKRR
jgi:hypothetical protein